MVANGHLETAQNYATSFMGWASTKLVEGVQTLNSQNTDAIKKLQSEGIELIAKFHDDYKGDEVTASEIAEQILSLQAPVQTLEVISLGGAAVFYSGAQVLPWILSKACKVGMYSSFFFAYQFMEVNEAINREYYVFEVREDEEISKEEFLKATRRLGNNILGSSCLVRLITSVDSTRSYRKMDEKVNEMIGKIKMSEEGKPQKTEEGDFVAETLDGLNRELGKILLVAQIFGVQIPTTA